LDGGEINKLEGGINKIEGGGIDKLRGGIDKLEGGVIIGGDAMIAEIIEGKGDEISFNVKRGRLTRFFGHDKTCIPRPRVEDST
jgi:hypothetical protein